MLRAVAIDDEPAGINTLRVLIERFPGLIRLVESATEAEKGITLIENYRPDVVFLDISMPDMSGFELLKRVSYKNFKLVFITAHKDFAVQAIKNGAFDYLLKPIDEEDFLQCINRLGAGTPSAPKKKTPPAGEEIIEITVRDGIIYLRQKDIIRIEASGSYTCFFVDGGLKYLASKKMKDYEALLNPRIFFRCHNSHIINLQKVQKFINHDGFFAQMCDGSMVDISRRNKDLFLERIKGV